MPFDTVEDVRSLSQPQINKLTNAQLKTALSIMVNADSSSDPSNAVLLQEIRSLKNDVEEIKNVKKDVTELTGRLDQAFKIIQQQQLFLESLDARERQRKLIITGLQEEPDDLGANDQEKLKTVLDSAGYSEDFDVANWEVRRLGQNRNSGKRPILVVVESQLRRRAILEKARNLKEAGPPLSRIYIKKDVHPAVRKELGRLRKREKEERDKPENQGVNIKYDSEQRVLLRDGIVIDRYAPSFF